MLSQDNALGKDAYCHCVSNQGVSIYFEVHTFRERSDAQSQIGKDALRAGGANNDSQQNTPDALNSTSHHDGSAQVRVESANEGPGARNCKIEAASASSSGQEVAGTSVHCDISALNSGCSAAPAQVEGAGAHDGAAEPPVLDSGGSRRVILIMGLACGLSGWRWQLQDLLDPQHSIHGGALYLMDVSQCTCLQLLIAICPGY